uniref:MobA-like NTP transferase domain-containing protein n=1 Tax=viral metagenome TaxID=1070528 RepID=A0A6C0K5S2_9ZZZZ
MKSKCTVFILAGGFGTSFQLLYPSVPKPLVPLGHNPSLCILLETLLELSDHIDHIYILVFERHCEKFKREIFRWFYNDHDRIHLITMPDPQGTAKSIQYALEDLKKKGTMVERHLLLLHSNMPLISKITLADFIQHSLTEDSEEPVSVLVSKIKNLDNERVVVSDEDRITAIVPSPHPSPFCYLNTIMIHRVILEHLVDRIEQNTATSEYDIEQIVALYSTGAKMFCIHPYVANKECIIIRKVDDKNFAEEMYMEHRNNIFIQQCYGLWKKCNVFESRLSFLESKILAMESLTTPAPAPTPTPTPTII